MSALIERKKSGLIIQINEKEWMRFIVQACNCMTLIIEIVELYIMILNF